MNDLTEENAVNTMLIAIVQSQDSERAERALNKAGHFITRLPSSGGFLGRRNATLLIGIPIDAQPKIYELLQKTCRQRVEFIAVPLESTPLPLPAPTPITIGGATIFAINIEHYEEI
jgi:uncharacterized protein YaaQ